VGTGYEVLGDYLHSGVGTLYRYSTNITKASKLEPRIAADSFVRTPETNLSRIADGIVHLRLRAFATNGFLITPTNYPNSSAFLLTPSGQLGRLTNALTSALQAAPDQYDYYFWSNAVPAFLELELGILEPPVLDRFRSIGAGNAASQQAQREYLFNHVGQVHVFRQRIPVRNVDFAAYRP